MRIEVYVDDEREPRATFEPPQTFRLDTTNLADGPHRLRVYAVEGDGPRSVEELPFTVRNGPGIAIVGIAEDEVVSGSVSVLVNAYESRIGDEFEPVRVETPAPIPTWTWVLFLVVGAWALWYLGDAFRARAATLAAAAPSPAASSRSENVAGAARTAWRAVG